MRDTIIYTAGPLRGFGDDWKQRENIDKATRVARELWRRGYTVICPHLNNLNFDGPDLVCDDFMAGDFVIIERCDALVVLPGWEDSAGTRMEIEFAQNMGILVYFWSDGAYKNGIPNNIKPRGDTDGA